MANQQDIQSNIQKVQEKINVFCEKYKRNKDEITLVAVSKYHPIDWIEAAYNCGIRDFGENYFQEWKEKQEKLSHLQDIRWHLIGHMQTKKAKYFTNSIHCLQSLDSLSLASEIEKKSSLNSRLNVLVQLQVDSEDKNKSGIVYEKSAQLCEFILKSQKLFLCGFMGMGPLESTDERRKDLYRQFMRNAEKLWKDFSQDENKKPYYSLGMSSDMEIAVECGSNMLRIGTAIFGER